MKKEAINTFGDGLIMDLHPLTTPNNVLTNCLNGTIITYNGNEFVLQNDMGNGKVDTAFLPKGYVPVGMKEHGGIIYVASHNPITKKSLLGSFPSPLLLFNGEDLNVNNINFNFNNLVEYLGSLLNIKSEYYKEKLFTDLSTGEAKKFHPGDRFIITIDSISKEIKLAADLGIINFRLGVLNSKGNIDYIDNSKLKIYTEPTGYWIFCYTNNKTTEEILKDNSLVLVFSAPSSGELLFIIEYKTIEAFNLLRQYSFNDGVISIRFFGNMQSSSPMLNGSTLENTNIGLVMDNSVKSEITLSGTSSTKITNKEIAPASVYGVLNRLKKIINIDFSTIKPNEESSTEWRYYITDTYIKIGWSYDYYNVDINSQVSKIVFTFIDFTKSDSALDSLSGEYSVDIIKEYYNGSFEEVFSFNDRLKKNWIYIVKIDRYINDKKLEDSYYRLLYTGTLFNLYYSQVLNYNELNQEIKTVPYKLNINTKIKSEEDFIYQVSTPSTSGFVETVPNVDLFRKSVESTDTNISAFRYIVKKNKTYKVESSITSDFEYDNVYAGRPNKQNLVERIQGSIIGQFGDADESDLSYSDPKSALNASILVDTTKSDITLDKNIEGDIGTLTGTITTNRSIISKAGIPRDDSYNSKSLVPYYYTNMPTFSERKVIGFTLENSYIRCITGTEDKVEYNGKLSNTGLVQAGTNAGPDDAAMYTCVANMGNATVNVWAGRGGDDASIGWEGITRIDNIDGWRRGEKSNEIDVHDNWLIAVWKTEDGGAHPINLASLRTAPRNTITSRTLIRTDMMLKCYLSLLLIVNSVLNKKIIVGADADSYTFHNAYNTKVPLDITLSTSTETVDFYLDNDDVSINDRMSLWMSKIPELKNYLPIFLISNATTYTEELSLGNDINFTSDSLVLDCYTNAYSVSGSNIVSDLDENRIYIGIPSGTANSDGTMPLQTDSNGNYLYRDGDNIIADWRNRESILNYNINDRFVILEDGDFREILVKLIGRHNGRWYKKKDEHAPDILAGIHFGRTKLYNE